MQTEHTASAPSQKPHKSPRYPPGHPLAWPTPPEGLTNFALILFPKAGKNWRPLRLRQLSDEQLEWGRRTFEVEARRRLQR